MIMEVNINGLDQVQSMIADLSKRKAKVVKEQALIAGATFLKKQIQANVPVDDGVYRDGIEVSEQGKKYIVHSGRVPHAHLVEFGRSGGQAQYVDKNGVTRTVKFGPVAPNPVVARTVERESQRVIDVMANEVRKELGI